MIGCLLDLPALAPPPTVTGVFRIGPAVEAWQVRAYFALRRAVFCDEQRLFTTTDRDADDAAATPIVAVSSATVADDDVVGTVRIHESAPGVWFGSRLAVDAAWRGVPTLAAGLVRSAVTTAHTRGCHTFLATVQRQNVPLFRRLHWYALGDVTVCGRPHQLMRADLAHYPPPEPGRAGAPRLRFGGAS
jgi:putative N-acetyltransferase (TIGR04045 family)